MSWRIHNHAVSAAAARDSKQVATGTHNFAYNQSRITAHAQLNQIAAPKSDEPMMLTSLTIPAAARTRISVVCQNARAMRRSARGCAMAVVACLTVMAGPAFASTPNAAAIAHGGNGHGAVACAACHGAEGGGQAVSGIPRLAGLNAIYLQRQLESFRDGTRRSPVMTSIAKALTPTEQQALARYYSEMPIPAAAASSTGTAASDALGREWALRGRWSKQAPSCVACHGPDGVGVGANFPPLAGQPDKYIADQLQAFKDGTRSNDPLGMMRHVAAAMTEKDIQAVSAWFAAQSARPQGDRTQGGKR